MKKQIKRNPSYILKEVRHRFGRLTRFGAPDCLPPVLNKGELKKGGCVALNSLPTGATARVDHFVCGKELSDRLLVLGLTIGGEVVVAQNYGAGPIILSVKDSRIALGRGEAQKVMVVAVDLGE